MAKLHLKFKHFNPQVKEAAHELLYGRPWDGDDKEKQEKFERFLVKASAAYGVETPRLVVEPTNMFLMLARGAYRAEDKTIFMAKYSVLTLFHEFRHHLNVERGVDSGEEYDVIAWSTSLFYQVRPTLFRKRVREGRILFIQPEDLLRSPENAEG